MGSLFWIYDDLCSAFVAGINLTPFTGKAIAAGAVGDIPLQGGAAIVAKDELYKLIHS